MTSDGITKRDWDRVHGLTLKLVNATLVTESRREKLFSFLDQLEEKYGRLPTILATKGDFNEDPLTAITYLEEAHSGSLKIGDIRNQVYILSSLIELYFGEGQFNDCQERIDLYDALISKHSIEEESDFEDIRNSIKNKRAGKGEG